MAVYIELLDQNFEPLSGLDFGDITAGEISSTAVVIVANDYSEAYSVEEATNVVLKLLDENGTEDSLPIQECWFQYRVGTPSDTATPLVVDETWKPLGAGHTISLGNIQRGTYRTVFLRAVVPPYATTGNLNVQLSVGYGAYFSTLSKIEYEFSDDGVVCEIDSNETCLRSGFNASVSGPTVSIGFGEVVFADGVNRVFDPTEVALNEYDVNNEALAEGEVYPAIIYLSEDGIGVTKGEKSSGEYEYPEPEAGQVELYQVLVSYGVTITIDDQRLFSEFNAVVDEDTVIVGEGRAVVNYSYIESPSRYIFGLTTGYIGLNEYGYVSLSSTTEDISLPLFACDPSNITKDYRHFIGSRFQLLACDDTVAKEKAVVFNGLTVTLATEGSNVSLFAGIAEHDPIDNVVHVLDSGIVRAITSGTISSGDALTFANDGALQATTGSGVAVAIRQADTDRWYVKL